MPTGALPDLPVRVPSPDWYIGRSSHFPFGVLGALKLPGTPLARHLVTEANQKQLALGIGTFIATLHGIDPGRFPSGNLPRSDMRWYELNMTRSTILPLLRDELTESEHTRVAGWWNAYLNDERMRFFSPVIQHGDLESENILISHDCEAVSCVVDFETIAIDDPAQDIAAQLHLGSAFALAVLDQYQAAGGILDEDFEYRVQRHWELRSFNGMRLAIHHENQREFDRLLARLRTGPLLDDTTRRETQIWPPLRR